QAEDGIRDRTVTGVQTCALPIFFSSKAFADEEEQRRDAHKWETCLKATKTFYPTSLSDPAFDVHYNARLGGAQSDKGKPISYARSEERRVGKECRARGTRETRKK